MWGPDILQINQADSHRNFNKPRGVVGVSRSYSRDYVAADDGADPGPAVHTQDYGPTTVIYEDNYACVRQMSIGFIKVDWTKHVSPHIFGFSQDLIDHKQLSILKIESENNIAHMLTKALPACKHKKLVYATGLRILQELTSVDN